jgi:hypothetical protein
LPGTRYDAEASASAASLFLSLPQPIQWEEFELCAGEGRTHCISNTKGVARSDARASACDSGEIKEIREGGGNINDGGVAIREGEVAMAHDNEA